MLIDPSDAKASDPDDADGAACLKCGNDSAATLFPVRIGDQVRPRRYRMYCGCCGSHWTRSVYD
jgi:hypothetical protein